jgi:hypothetical protein
VSEQLDHSVAANSNPKRNRRRTIIVVSALLMMSVASGGVVILRNFTSLGQKAPAPFTLPDRPVPTAQSVPTLQQENS